MKKAIVLSILGLAASGIAAFGQGQIIFNNYDTTTYEPVYYCPAPAGAPPGEAGANADVTTEVQLFYEIGNATGDNLAQFYSTATAGNTTFISSTLNAGGSYHGSPTAPGSTGGPGGYYNGGIQTLTGWVSGDTVTFGVRGWETAGAYGGPSFATSLLTGQSALWTEEATITSTAPPTPPADFMANGPTPLELNGLDLPSPEPTTLAFAGMGLLSLLALARSKRV